jgi:superfamily II DNA or RNA helicase
LGIARLRALHGRGQRPPRLIAIDRERGYHSEEPEHASYLFDIRPYPYQQRILDALEAERTVGGHWRNLVVAATGTGKTAIAAFDYRRFCEKGMPGKRAHLLFVAHREEILEQALSCFRGVLKDENFGSLMLGGRRPASYDQLFVSVQTFSSRRLWEKVAPDFYDYIVVDEIHHGAAASYSKIFEELKPKVLLGLTATPERMDGRSILPYFDGRIAAEISLSDAIERKLLCPFSYFGVSDSCDLSGLSWKRGGYETSELEQVYVFSEKVAERRCSLIIDALRRYVTDVSHMHALGFCVSKAHAQFMAARFRKAGIAACAVTADTDEAGRRKVRQDLASGALKIVFAVDIYNEGVDIPEVDTVLFLRPTQSLTIFMQQLGRGLRLAPGKECLTVLDFIGQQNRSYDFAPKLRALLAHPSASLRAEVEEGFPEAPKGCYISSSVWHRNVCSRA